MPKMLLPLVALLCVVRLPMAKGQGKLSVCLDCIDLHMYNAHTTSR